MAASPGHLLLRIIFISQTFRPIQFAMYKTTKKQFHFTQKCTNRSTRFHEAADIRVMTDALTWSVLLKCRSTNTPASPRSSPLVLVKSRCVTIPTLCYIFYFTSVLIVLSVPSVFASLPPAGLPASVFTLCGTTPLVRRTASSSSAFLLPFPLPLAGASAERRI